MFWKFNAIALLWAFLILLGSIVSGDIIQPRNGFWGLGVDKVGHALMYFIFFLLLYIGFKKQHHYGYLTLHPRFVGVGVALVYGILMECLQWFIPSREFDLMDILANTFGIVLGFFLSKGLGVVREK